MNRIQNKDHRIGILFHQNIIQQNAIVLFCRRNIYQKQWIRWFSSWLLELIIKISYFNNYLEKLFCQANCFIS